MSPKIPDAKCALLVMTDGLEETKIIEILCTMRQAGLCVKSMGLTSGLVTGIHGILLKPDLTLADFESGALDMRVVKMVILMERNQGIARLETEPRLHHLLLHTLVHGGYVAITSDGRRIMKAVDMSADQLKACRENHQILIYDWQQSFDTYINELIRCLDGLQPVRSNHKLIRRNEQ